MLFEQLIKNAVSKEEAVKYINTLDSSNWIKTKEDKINEIKLEETVYCDPAGLLTLPEGQVLIAVGKYVGINISFNDKWLMEYKQEYVNGKTTSRNIPCAGKCGMKELPSKAALRELKEELKLPESALIGLRFDHGFEDVKKSRLFGGETFLMLTNIFECALDERFYKPEYVEHQDDKSTYFKWVKEKPKF